MFAELPRLTHTQRTFPLEHAGKRLLVSPPQKPGIGPVPTDSGLVNRIDAFLREAKARPPAEAGAPGTAETAETADMVELDDDFEGQHVELDLACGVFDLIDDEAVRAAEAACAGQTAQEGDGRQERDSVRPLLVQEVAERPWDETNDTRNV